MRPRLLTIGIPVLLLFVVAIAAMFLARGPVATAVCDPAVLSADATSTKTNLLEPDEPPITWTYEFEGDDSYGEAVINGNTYRLITKDGIRYHYVAGHWGTPQPAALLVNTGFCGPTLEQGDDRSDVYTMGISTYTLVGTGIVDGVRVKRFDRVSVSTGSDPTPTPTPWPTPHPDPLVNQLLNEIAREVDTTDIPQTLKDLTLYVDSNNFLVRMDIMTTVLHNGEVLRQDKFVWRYSGYGETNVIETPVVPTPTPTPTPTATPLP